MPRTARRDIFAPQKWYCSRWSQWYSIRLFIPTRVAHITSKGHITHEVHITRRRRIELKKDAEYFKNIYRATQQNHRNQRWSFEVGFTVYYSCYTVVGYQLNASVGINNAYSLSGNTAYGVAQGVITFDAFEIGKERFWFYHIIFNGGLQYRDQYQKLTVWLPHGT